jgi:serine/threonine protein kinase
VTLVLYSSNGNLWKITDFGLTVEGTSKRAITTVYSRGTGGYRAPELLLDNPKFSSKVNIWALLGCILYELAAGEKAFASDLQVRDFSFSHSTLPVSIPFFPRNFVMHISECINEMLGKKAQNRPPISTIRLLLRQKMAAADQVRGEVVITMTVEE